MGSQLGLPLSWIKVSVLVGVGYAAVGILFALPAAHVQVWRLAAWLVCGAGYAGHIVYERGRRGRSSAVAAWHVAAAAVVGAFGLAVSANMHSLFVDSTTRQHQLLLLSLVLWPILVGIPAFVV